MLVPVDYRVHELELRINGWVFQQIWLATYTFDKVMKYGIMVEDRTFGRFEVSSNMVVEWKSDGRWYQTKPQLVIDHILTKRGAPYGCEEARRNRRDGG